MSSLSISLITIIFILVKKCSAKSFNASLEKLKQIREVHLWCTCDTVLWHSQAMNILLVLKCRTSKNIPAGFMNQLYRTLTHRSGKIFISQQAGQNFPQHSRFPVCISLFFPSKSQNFLVRSFPSSRFFQQCLHIQITRWPSE